jgi:prepilin-type N-terminal cleavage/methylation domain-containing protein
MTKERKNNVANQGFTLVELSIVIIIIALIITGILTGKSLVTQTTLNLHSLINSTFLKIKIKQKHKI